MPAKRSSVTPAARSAAAPRSAKASARKQSMGNGGFFQLGVSLMHSISIVGRRIGVAILRVGGPFSHSTPISVRRRWHALPSAIILSLGGQVHPGGMLRRGRLRTVVVLRAWRPLGAAATTREGRMKADAALRALMEVDVRNDESRHH